MLFLLRWQRKSSDNTGPWPLKVSPPGGGLCTPQNVVPDFPPRSSAGIYTHPVTNCDSESGGAQPNICPIFSQEWLKNLASSVGPFQFANSAASDSRYKGPEPYSLEIQVQDSHPEANRVANPVRRLVCDSRSEWRIGLRALWLGWSAVLDGRPDSGFEGTFIFTGT